MKKIEIYTWSYCPYCVKAKTILDGENVAYDEFEISSNPNKLSELKAKTGSGTVPQIFVDGKFFGGCDDLVSIVNAGNFDNVFK